MEQNQILYESISILSPSDERWLAFLAINSQANIFHHPAWSQLLADCYGFKPFIIASCDRNAGITAGLPVMEIKSWLTGNRWVSLPFTDHCLPLSINTSGLNYLVNGLLNQAVAQGFSKVELRGTVPTHPALQQFAPYVLHKLTLEENFSKVDCRIHPMHRRNANIAQKRGVRVEIGKDFEHMRAFYKLHVETRRRQGVPVQPWQFFNLLKSILVEEDLGFLLLAYKQEEIIAALVLLGWNHTLTYKYGASSTDSLRFRPNDLLFRTAIQWGCENGYKSLDFGRTDLANEGLRTFKSRWGAEETPLIYHTLSATPAQHSSGRTEALMHRVIRYSPIWVCRLAGALLYRHFG